MTGPISWWKLIPVDPAKNKNPDQQDLFRVFGLSMLLVLPSSHWHSKNRKKALSAPVPSMQASVPEATTIATKLPFGTPQTPSVCLTSNLAWHGSMIHMRHHPLLVTKNQPPRQLNLAPWRPWCSRWGPCKLSCSDCNSWRMTSQRWRWIWILRSIEGWGWWGWWG